MEPRTITEQCFFFFFDTVKTVKLIMVPICFLVCSGNNYTVKE